MLELYNAADCVVSPWAEGQVDLLCVSLIEKYVVLINAPVIEKICMETKKA